MNRYLAVHGKPAPKAKAAPKPAPKAPPALPIFGPAYGPQAIPCPITGIVSMDQHPTVLLADCDPNRIIDIPHPNFYAAISPRKPNPLLSFLTAYEETIVYRALAQYADRMPPLPIGRQIHNLGFADHVDPATCDPIILKCRRGVGLCRLARLRRFWNVRWAGPQGHHLACLPPKKNLFLNRRHAPLARKRRLARHARSKNPALAELVDFTIPLPFEYMAELFLSYNSDEDIRFARQRVNPDGTLARAWHIRGGVAVPILHSYA